MTAPPIQLDWLEPAIISPGAYNTFINAVAEDEREFLLAQLTKHLFSVTILAGHQMHDHHGFRRALAAAFDLKESSLEYGRSAVPEFAALFERGPARRVAIVIEQADRLIESDMQRFIALNHALAIAADALKSAAPAPTQLLTFLLGPAPAFPLIEPAAKRRAEAVPGLKLMPGDIRMGAWQCPRDFDLGPPHQWTLSPAEWYYCSRGRRAEGPDDRWHCIEHEHRLIFIRADDGAPCFEGVFARTARGMQLVGLQYESDDARRGLSLVAEDPFTLFRRLCHDLGLC